MVRIVHTAIFVVIAVLAGLAISACRDIDDPPPLPVLDPNAPVDGGSDAANNGGMASSTIDSGAHSFA